MTLSVNITKSVDTGMLLRIRDKGHQAFNGEFGDLILKVKVESHPQFKRVDFDIHSIISIPVTKAIFGGALEIETINGPK